MGKSLIANVFVDGRWYGPSHGSAEPPAKIAEKITNPGAWEDTSKSPFDLRNRADDFGGENVPNLAALAQGAIPGGVNATVDQLDALEIDDLRAYAAARGLEVKPNEGKASIIKRLTGE